MPEISDARAKVERKRTPFLTIILALDYCIVGLILVAGWGALYNGFGVYNDPQKFGGGWVINEEHDLGLWLMLFGALVLIFGVYVGLLTWKVQCFSNTARRLKQHAILGEIYFGWLGLVGIDVYDFPLQYPIGIAQYFREAPYRDGEQWAGEWAIALLFFVLVWGIIDIFTFTFHRETVRLFTNQQKSRSIGTKKERILLFYQAIISPSILLNYIAFFSLIVLLLVMLVWGIWGIISIFMRLFTNQQKTYSVETKKERTLAVYHACLLLFYHLMFMLRFILSMTAFSLVN